MSSRKVERNARGGNMSNENNVLQKEVDTLLRTDVCIDVIIIQAFKLP